MRGCYLPIILFPESRSRFTKKVDNYTNRSYPFSVRPQLQNITVNEFPGSFITP